MRAFFYRTFAKVALLPYLGGTILHLVRLGRGQAEIQIPFEVDYFIVFIGGYAGTGFVVFSRRIPFEGMADRVLYGLVAFHLLGSVILHARAILINNHDVFRIFSLEYSYFAVVYFVILGGYCFLLQRRLSAARSRSEPRSEKVSGSE